MPTLTQIAYTGLRDIGELRPGQGTSPDAIADILTKANQMIDSWANERLPVYTSAPAVFTAFADATTNYNFSPGYQELIQANLAVRIAPMMKIYAKISSQEWDSNVAQVAAVAAAKKKALGGVGIPSLT